MTIVALYGRFVEPKPTPSSSSSTVSASVAMSSSLLGSMSDLKGLFVYCVSVDPLFMHQKIALELIYG